MQLLRRCLAPLREGTGCLNRLLQMPTYGDTVVQFTRLKWFLQLISAATTLSQTLSANGISGSAWRNQLGIVMQT